jgi:FAD/FMN-containing dehydrogenase
MSDFTELSIDGRVATPSDSDWDEARQAWNLAADLHPSAVVFVEGADDVSQVLRFAAERGLGVTGQSTGHGAAALGPLDDTILIKTERMRGIDVDAEARAVRVEAGVLAHELETAAQREGLCSLHGATAEVGVVGYTLGGGWSWVGRRYGLACNHVNAIELVGADGEARRVDAESDPDLFWALRGGGGGYGIVTALHLGLLPLSELYAGLLIFPAEIGAEGIRAYRDWAASLPDEVTSIVRLLRPPPRPDVPEAIRDRLVLTIAAACIGSREEGEKTIAPLRELGEPIMDTFAQIPAQQLTSFHMDPAQPVPGLGHHVLLRELPDEAIDAFVGAAGPESGSPLLTAMIRQAGGALAREPAGAGALGRLDAGFSMLAYGVPTTPEVGQAITRHHDRLHDAMQPWAASGGFLNMAERPAPLEEILPPDTCDRLAEVKRRWDPDGMIRANHEISLTPA